MKTIQKLLALAGLAASLATLSARQPAEPAAKPETTPAVPADAAVVAPAPAVSTNEAPATPSAPAPAARTDGLIMMNFHGASLDTVLNHLSEAAGFIINVKPGTSVKGKVDAWSSQPLTKDEALELLDTVLIQNNLAAIHNGRTLTILNRDEAKVNDVPVRLERDPAKIAKTDRIVTQIIPVQFVEVAQLLKDLQPLVSSQNTTMTANEAGNAIVITDTSANIHRVAEIIQAIDSGAQAFTEVRLFKLVNADPNETADLLSNLFPDDSKSGSGSSGGGSSPFSRFASRFGGFGGGGPPGFGGPPGGGGNSGGGSDQRVKKRARVIAIADQRTASVVVSAAKELMEQIEGVIKELDADTRGRTVVKTFSIQNTDMQQLQQVMTDMFQKSGTSANRNNSQNQPTVLGNRSSAQNNQNGTGSRSSSGFGTSSGRSGSSSGGSLLQP